MSNSLWPHGLQHARPPCPSPIPGVHPNPCPSSWWYHPTISSSVVPFSSLSQSFPASGLFKWVSSCIRWPKYWSFSFNISSSSEHPGLISFRMDWLDLLAVQGTLKSLLQGQSCLLILWLQSIILSDFGTEENKIYHCLHFFPIYFPWSDGSVCHDLSFLNVEF